VQKPELCVMSWEAMQNKNDNCEVDGSRTSQNRESVFRGAPSSASTRPVVVAASAVV
jgi:hypothetical protein